MNKRIVKKKVLRILNSLNPRQQRTVYMNAVTEILQNRKQCKWALFHMSKFMTTEEMQSFLRSKRAFIQSNIDHYEK